VVSATLAVGEPMTLAIWAARARIAKRKCMLFPQLLKSFAVTIVDMGGFYYCKDEFGKENKLKMGESPPIYPLSSTSHSVHLQLSFTLPSHLASPTNHNNYPSHPQKPYCNPQESAQGVRRVRCTGPGCSF